MSAIIQDFASGAALIEGLHAFLLKGHTLRPSITGVGNGWCDDAIGTAASVHEIITLTFTSSTAFSVSGSVSGAMGTGSVGTLFSHARFRCTISAGSTAWAAGDTIVWTMTAPWQSLVYSSGQSYIYRAPGNDGNQEVNVGWTVKSNSSGGYFGVRIGAYPTVLPDGSYWKQNTKCWWPLGSYSGSAIRLFAVASGQACWMTARIGSYYISAIAGYVETSGTLDQRPFPYIVGGAKSWATEPADTSTDWLYTASQGGPLRIKPATSADESYEDVGGEALIVRAPWNRWCSVFHDLGGESGYATTGKTYVMWGNLFNPAALQSNLDGSIPCWPFTITRGRASTERGSMSDFYGTLPFVWRIPAYDGTGNLIIAESVFRSAQRTKLVALQVGSSAAETSLFALEMY